MSRSDPIRENYYTSVQMADKAEGVLFLVGALLSFCTLLIDQKRFGDLYVIILVAFGLLVVSLFTLGVIQRLYLTPRAEDKRRKDFFSSAWNVSLIHQKTDGYYNNDIKAPVRRMAAQVLENSLFTKEIVLRMVRHERVKIGAYLLIWLFLLFYRRIDIGWVLAASQVLFSEQIVSRWLRLEWLRIRSEKTFDDVFKLFQTRPAAAQFNAHAFDAVTMYESTKATAAITLSADIFEKLNPSLSNEWEGIKKALDL